MPYIALLVAVASLAGAAGAAPPALSPTPQSAEWGAGTVRLVGPVQIVGPSAPSRAVQRLRELLRGVASLQDVRSSIRSPRPGGTAIVVCDSGPAGLPAWAREGMPDGKGWDRLGAEGYCLRVRSTPAAAEIVIAANRPAGAFYAVQTLRQLVRVNEGGASLPECLITDRPSMRIRGVKGLYWKPDQYVRMLPWLPTEKLNFLMLCYSLYPETWAEWRRPFSPTELAELGAFERLAERGFVRICLAINPSINAKPSLRYGSDDDLRLLVAKYRSAWRLGYRSFALCLDDIAFELQNPEDRARFHDLAEAQASFVRRLVLELDRIEPGMELLFCPSTYATAHVSDPTTRAYIRRIGEEVPKLVHVFWTGPVVCSPEIRSTQAEEFGRWIGRKPFVWDNYPVNDYCTDRLHLAPLRNRDHDLPAHIDGWISNPMMQSEASKIPLATVADYLWNAEAYDPERSWGASLARLAQGRELGALQAVAEAYGDFLGEAPRFPVEGSGAFRDTLAALPLIRADRGVARLSADLESVLGVRLWRLTRVTGEKALEGDSVSWTGEELAGGGVDVYPRNYRGFGPVNWVYAAPTGLNTLTGRLRLRTVPAQPCTLTVEGLDDDRRTNGRVRLRVNETVVAEGPNGFSADRLTERAYAIPPGALRAGTNTISIESIEPTGIRGMPPWFMVRKVGVRMATAGGGAGR